MVQFLLDFSRGSGAVKSMQNSRRSSGGHHLDLKVALRHQLLQTRILRLKVTQPPRFLRAQRSELLAPDVDRLMLIPCRFATSATGSLTRSRTTLTICSSASRDCRIHPQRASKRAAETY